MSQRLLSAGRPVQMEETAGFEAFPHRFSHACKGQAPEIQPTVKARHVSFMSNVLLFVNSLFILSYLS
jgi:hypothetical protein